MKTLFAALMMISAVMIVLGGFTIAGIVDNKDKNGETPEEFAKQCIQTSRIEEIDVIDNKTIVFHMIQDKSWVNTLPYYCPNLYHEGGFKYDRQVDKLCSADIITVINTYTKCGLGTFKPYTNIDVQKGS